MLKALKKLFRRRAESEVDAGGRNVDAGASLHSGMPPNYVKSYDDGRPKH